jgi:acyl-coenzyme A synthetase/AMP-(fatty) acid ligase
MTGIDLPCIDSGDGLAEMWERIQSFEGPALISAGETTTFADLCRLTRAALVHLDHRVFGDVTIVAHKTPATIATILACFVRKRCVLLASPTLPLAIIDELAMNSGCRTLIDPAESFALDPGDLDRPGSASTRSSTAVLLATSGSTGVPKLVPLPRDAVSAFLSWAGTTFELGPGSITLSYAPLSFDLSLLDVWAALSHGAATVLVRPHEAIQGRRLVELIARHRVTTVQAVPIAFRIMEQAADHTELPHVRHVMFTGERLASSTMQWIQQVFPAARHFNIYGCTETNDSFIHEVDPCDELDDDLPIGRPLPGVSALILDSERQPIDGSGHGELWVSTPFQTSGYVDPAQTAQRMVDFECDGRRRTFVRSGDIVERDAVGTVRLRGRIDNQVKVRGVAVNIDEVEHVIRGHDDVGQVAVVAVDDLWGGTSLAAVIQRRPGRSLNTLDVKTYLLTRLNVAAVPSALVFTDDALPATTSGKIDRRRVLSDLAFDRQFPDQPTTEMDPR